MKLRPYQEDSINSLCNWWNSHKDIKKIPLVVAPTGSGKSVTIADLTRQLFDTYPEDHPRTLVIVPSKELAEQNASKLKSLLPSHLKVGFYSASISKDPEADVIVATIGSVFKAAHILGDIKCVIIDEAHLVNPEGNSAGRYRQFLDELSKYCKYCAAGFTATPFRGDGVWLTDGKNPFFTGVAHTTFPQDLIDNGFLSPLVRPIDALKTRINTDKVQIVSGDYNIKQLSECVDAYLKNVAIEATQLASDRKKWIAFTPTVANAMHLVHLLREQGISSYLVCGATDKKIRADLIDRFRRGEIRCLVTVLALATGFDVPDVDCVIWCRPTKSPVLYCQGAGRGMRIASEKKDCLWLDFTDTTERMGPVDGVKGKKRRDSGETDPLTKICSNCGEVYSIKLPECPSCGFFVEDEEKLPEVSRKAVSASDSPIMLSQSKLLINEYKISDAKYSVHTKVGSKPTLRVDYYAGIRRVVTEWVCFEHEGFAREKAMNWWKNRDNRGLENLNTLRILGKPYPDTVNEALEVIQQTERNSIVIPAKITVNESEKFPKIVFQSF